MPNAALQTKKPISGTRKRYIGSVKYFGASTMPSVHSIAISVNTRCSASPNHENQPVRKWKRWPRVSVDAFDVIQSQRAFMICIAPNAQR